MSDTVSGWSTTLVAILREAVKPPEPCGENVIENVQLPPADTELPQLFCCAKNRAPWPVSLIFSIWKAVVPVFVNVMANVALEPLLIVPKFM